jgi:hypothetical protein
MMEITTATWVQRRPTQATWRLSWAAATHFFKFPTFFLHVSFSIAFYLAFSFH